MSIKIVTDSTCDLPREVIEELDITVLPCFINFPSKSYLDGVDLTSEDFYRKVNESTKYPTSSSPALGAFTIAYRTLLEKGATAVLSIHLSAKLASTYNNAIVAAKSVARSAQLDLPLETILREITDLSKRTYAYATVNT